MYTITGITGKVGGTLARKLLEAEQPVRAVVRNAAKGQTWADKGCEVAIAEMEDAEALAQAFASSEAVFILPPSEFDPEPGYPEAQNVVDAVVAALSAARPARVLCLSTVGADASEKAFANALGHPVRVEIVPRDTWEILFRGQGMKNPQPRMRMLDGFNEGWIDFPRDGDLALKGIVSAETVIGNLVKSAG